MDSGGHGTDPLIGTVVDDRYRVLELVGEGGMGVVYRAQHLRTERMVALKVLHAPFARRAELVQRFEREARAVTRVGDPHVVEVLDFGELATGAPYMVMELLDGRNLDEELEESGRLSVERAVGIVIQACDTLEKVHARDIVHRDLKPDNLFLIEHLGQPDFVKILDFGIAKIRKPDDVDATQLTATGALIGTPAYMSPEQAEGLKDVDARADIYALGGILYYALVGSPPFNAPNLPMLILEVTNTPPPDIRMRRPDVPPGVAAVVQQAMAKDPSKRHASAAALRDALTTCIEPLAEGTSLANGSQHGEPRPPSSTPPRARRTPLVVAAGLVMLAAVALGVLWLVDARDPNADAAAPVSTAERATPPIPSPTLELKPAPKPTPPRTPAASPPAAPSSHSKLLRRTETRRTPVRESVRRATPASAAAPTPAAAALPTKPPAAPPDIGEPAGPVARPAAESETRATAASSAAAPSLVPPPVDIKREAL